MILFRLLKKLKDGYEVVGYEKHVIYDEPENEFGIRILHIKESRPIPGREGTQHSWYDIVLYPHMSIIHDRKDQLLVEYYGVKYYAMDMLTITMPQTFDEVTKEGYLYYDAEHGKVMMNFPHDRVAMPFWQPETYEWVITKSGIEGVKEKI
jgi:hypothetical protein